jgi:hypothetical protein
MTDAPAQIHNYEGADRYELIDTPAGKLPRWHAIAHFIGETNALMRARDDALAEFAAIRNDAAVLQAQVKELSAQERALKELAVKAVDALLRADSLVKRVGAFEQRQRADQKRADQKRRLDQFLGNPSEQNKEPEPPQDQISLLEGEPPDDPSEAPSEGEAPIDPRGEGLRLNTPTIPPVLDTALMDTIQPRTPVAAGFDKR